MLSFFERISARVGVINSRLCVGIDPHPHLVEETMGNITEDTLYEWCTHIAYQTAEHAACFKINIAFFEAQGSRGFAALERIIPTVQALAPVILDAKRGDISSTAEAYAKACYDIWKVDSVTINPYLGMDSFAPFLSNSNAGIFLLCHTSNPSAYELQRRIGTDTLPLYSWIAKEAASHPKSNQIGLVVGATQTDVFATIRQYAPKTWLLCPGVGAQGGSLEKTIQAGWGQEGNILIPVSREIAQASNMRQKAEELKEAIRAAQPKHNLSTTQQQLARLLMESQCVLFGEFTLKSGIQSPIYIDLRNIIGHPTTFQATIAAYSEYVQKLSPDALAALPFAGLPIASGLALQNSLPLCYPRPPKNHGTQQSIEGGIPAHTNVLLIDDLATRGASAIEALPIIRSQYNTENLLVLIDRQSGATEALQKHGVTLHSIFRLTDLLHFWREESYIEENQLQRVLTFLAQES